MTLRRVLTFTIVGLLALWGLAAWLEDTKPSDRRATGSSVLRLSAAKGANAVQITNRENASLERCDVTVLDQGDDEWTAVIGRPIAPSETVTVYWNEFKARQQPMPAYVGRNRSRMIVSCAIGTERRSAGIQF